MLAIQSLIDHVNSVATDEADSRLPADWSAHWAWTMVPVEADDLPNQVPLVAFYQGKEIWSPREGSPCRQSVLPSVIVAIIVCNKRQLAERLRQLRSVLHGWNAPDDREHRALYLSDDPGLPCDVMDIKGDYLWWQDNWMTSYAVTSH